MLLTNSKNLIPIYAKKYGMSADEIKSEFSKHAEAYFNQKQYATNGNDLFNRDVQKALRDYRLDKGEIQSRMASEKGLSSTELLQLIDKGVFDNVIRKINETRKLEQVQRVGNESRTPIERGRNSGRIEGSSQGVQRSDNGTSARGNGLNNTSLNELETSSQERLVRQITGSHSKGGKIDAHKVYKRYI